MLKICVLPWLQQIKVLVQGFLILLFLETILILLNIFWIKDFPVNNPELTLLVTIYAKAEPMALRWLAKLVKGLYTNELGSKPFTREQLFVGALW